MQVQGNLSAILGRHAPVYTEGLGKMKGLRAKIAVKPGCKPKFWKPRPVPFARGGKRNTEMGRDGSDQARPLQ